MRMSVYHGGQAIRGRPKAKSSDAVIIGSGSYTVYCDTSLIGLGVVLMRDERVIAYASRQLKVYEKGLSVHDLELVSIVHEFTIWRHYLYMSVRTCTNGDSKKVIIRDDGVLRMQDQICVSNVDGLCELILEEAHSLRYSIHLGATKIYQDLRQHYWWGRMKKDIVTYVARCLNCQQVKYEHQRPTSLLQ
ncbi:uncharacterized protein [Nicotiana tomentosiformis]|uniref:uncharacterized protein n=1 Tax=Nicotiana tomentosiformis TaxID=4098 RepID=UPI00388CA8D6